MLAELEQRFLGGQSVARHFDMIAGTSTGGIIALGLAHGLTAKAIRDFYLQRGAAIFPPPSPIGRFMRWLRQKHRYVYERGPLKDELLQIFGDAVLGQACTRLCIRLLKAATASRGSSRRRITRTTRRTARADG